MLDIGGMQISVLVQTAHLELFEVVADAADLGPGLHFHRQMTEMFYLLSGDVAFTIGDRTFTASSGAFYSVPSFTIHQWKTCGPVRMLLLFSPACNQAEYLAQLAHFHQQQVPWEKAIALLSDRFDNHPVY